MIGYFLRHLTQYLLLFLIFAGGLVAFFGLTDKRQKAAMIMALVSLYLLWGIWHHHEEKNLTRRVFLEYLAIAGFILWLLVSLL